MAKGVSLSSINKGVNRRDTSYPGRGAAPSGQKWLLKSGDVAEFFEKDVPYEDVEDKTFVDFEVNGRWQDLLTEPVLERLSSLDQQQYFPAIGIEYDDGKIEILDGSNRRAYILSKNGAIPSFRVKFTRQKIKKSDAKALAKEIRTALEQSLYEIGMMAAIHAKDGLSQRAISEEIGISQSKISKGLRTQIIPKDIMRSFPSAYELSWDDYSKLISSFEILGDSVDEELMSEINSLSDTKKIVNTIVSYATAVKKLETNKKSKSIRTKLIEFDKGVRKNAEKIVSADRRTTTYRFSRVGSDADEIISRKLAEAIEEIKQTLM